MNYQKRLFFYNILLFVLPFMLVAFLIVNAAITEVNTRTNQAHLTMLEQADDNLTKVFQEITSFSNIFYWDTSLNSIISEKKPKDSYQRSSDARTIADLFRINSYAFEQYRHSVTILGTNKKYYTSLYDVNEIARRDIQENFTIQNWYKETIGKKGQLLYLPAYRTEPLAEYDQEAIAFAVREMHNLISGRSIGAMILSIRNDHLDDIYNKFLDVDTQKILVMDEQGIIFYASDMTFLKQDLKQSSYYDKLKDNDKGYFLSMVNGEKSQVVFVTNPVSGWKTIMYTPIHLFNQNWTFLFVFIVFSTILYFCLALFMSYYNAKIISRPVKNLSHAMHRLEAGDVAVRAEVLYEDELGELSKQFNRTAKKLGELMAALEENEEKKRLLEIQALQSQINPHFLYNTLASIRFMLQMDMPEKVDLALLSLVKLLKRTFSKADKMITLEEEFESVEHYLNLLKLRYDDKFSWSIQCEGEICHYKILKFILQPLVENSVTHGFGEIQEQGMITILGVIEEKDIIISVIDNGKGADIAYVEGLLNAKEEKNYVGQWNGIGMKNVHDRIRLFFGQRYGLRVYQREAQGMVVEVRIPQIMEM